MLIGQIRPVETQEFTITGPGLPELNAQMAEGTPPGWVAVRARVSMAKRDTTLTSNVQIARRDTPQEIEAETLDALRAAVPEGYQLLSVRKA